MSRLWIIGMVVAVAVVVSVEIFALIQEHDAWRMFSEEHSCKVVGKMSGDTATTTGFGMMPNGNFGVLFGRTRTPDKTGYLCDDGVTYWR